MEDQPTVLVVAPLSGHHSTLLRETVKQLLRDHKVYITDWTDARMVPLEVGPFHLDDYVHYVQEFIRLVGGADCHVMSVCQPTVPVLAAISLMASAGEPTPRSMTMMGGPVVAAHQVEEVVVVRGQVPVRVHCDEYNAVLDMPAEYYLDTIKTVFQDFALVNGTWQVDGAFVRPQDITTTALLTVEGELDDISGAGQTRAAHELCSGVPKAHQHHYDALGAGHYGIFSGRRWREKVYPEVRAFIAKYEAAPLKATSKAAPVKATAKPAAKRSRAATARSKA